MDWTSGGKFFLVDVFPTGEIRQAGRVAGRISGACVLDASGGVLRVVRADGSVYDGAGEKVGTLRPRRAMRDYDGNFYRVGDVWVTQDTPGEMGLSPDGAFVVGDLDATTARISQMASGDLARAARTALVVSSVPFDTPEPDGAPPPRRLPRSAECAQSEALSAAPFALTWSGDAGVRRIDVSASGEVVEKGRIIAKVAGACVLDPRDGIVAVVTRDHKIEDEDWLWLGSIDGDEVAAADDEPSYRFTEDGALLRSAPGGTHVVPVGHMEGAAQASGRAALLLYYLYVEGKEARR